MTQQGEGSANRRNGNGENSINDNNAHRWQMYYSLKSREELVRENATLRKKIEDMKEEKEIQKLNSQVEVGVIKAIFLERTEEWKKEFEKMNELKKKSESDLTVAIKANALLQRDLAVHKQLLKQLESKSEKPAANSKKGPMSQATKRMFPEALLTYKVDLSKKSPKMKKASQKEQDAGGQEQAGGDRKIESTHTSKSLP